MPKIGISGKGFNLMHFRTNGFVAKYDPFKDLTGYVGASNSSRNNKVLNLSKSKAFADDKSSIAKLGNFVFLFKSEKGKC